MFVLFLFVSSTQLYLREKCYFSPAHYLFAFFFFFKSNSMLLLPVLYFGVHLIFQWSANVARITEVPCVAAVPNSLVQRHVLKPFRYQTGGTILVNRILQLYFIKSDNIWCLKIIFNYVFLLNVFNTNHFLFFTKFVRSHFDTYFLNGVIFVL